MELAPFRTIVDMRPGVLRAVRVQMELAPFGEIVGTRPGVLRAVRVQMELAPFCYVHGVFGHGLADQGYANRDGMNRFNEAEREATRQRAEELRRDKGGNKKAKNLGALQKLIDAMPPEDRDLAAAVHRMVIEKAPQLNARTWYGMSAWEGSDGVVLFVQVPSKFGARYTTLGFQESAQLDDGSMWPTSYAIQELNDDTRARIRELIRRAAP